ncbi:TetR/AcrR family transcriptional regulator [Kitasatospora sp. NPDC059571]|uniref:TetR/AcrR family transcriptional regulator n=1 Tax=Kitasatospora sp. NPDC059571 TaxID=3346871 RepID=UPI0036C71A6F
MRQPSDAGPAVTTRRARNKERARERVYASAMTLISQKGYADTSVAEIAEHADIARGTFFNYFPRKEALVNAWAEQRRARLMCRLGSRPQRGLGVAEALRACMSDLGDLNEEDPALSMAMLTAWVQAGRPLDEESHLGAIFSGIVAAGRARGEVSSAVDPGLVGEVLRDLYLGALYRWIRQFPAVREYRPLGADLQADLQQALDLLLNGVAAPAGPHHDPR